MNIPESFLIRTLPYDEFFRREGQLTRAELSDGSEYTARLITSPHDKARFASEFSVVVERIRTVNRGRISRAIYGEIVELDLMPVEPDGRLSVDTKPDPYVVKTDGSLLKYLPVMCGIWGGYNVPCERGYLTAGLSSGDFQPSQEREELGNHDPNIRPYHLV